MRTQRPSRPHSVLRHSPLAAAVAIALVPAFALAEAPARKPVATQSAPVTDTSGSGPFVTGASAAMPAPKAGNFPDVATSPNPPSVDFGSVTVGETSPTRTIKLQSAGGPGYDYVIFSIGDFFCYGSQPICTSGDISCTSTCATNTPYAPGTGCTFTAKFTPQFIGGAYAPIYVCDNASGGSPRILEFFGDGAPPPIVTISPSSWDFGTVSVGKKSELRSFSLLNPAGTAADIGTILVTGPFEIVGNTCSSQVAPFGRCSVLVDFVPTESGPASGELVVPSNAPFIPAGDVAFAKGAIISAPRAASSAAATLSGTGVFVASMRAPSSIDLGMQVLGSAPLTQTITLTNTGETPVVFGDLTVDGPFTVTNGCPASLAPGASCNMVVNFNATTTGDFTGLLRIASNVDGGGTNIALAAHAQPVPIPVVRVSPSTIGFGSRVLGSTSESQKVTVTNAGGAPATLSGLTISVDYVILSNTCGATLSPQSSCSMDVALRPVGFGPRAGTLTFVSNAAGSPHIVNLGGTGCRPNGLTGNRSGQNAACAP